MNITKFALDNDRTALSLLTVLLVAGFYAFQSMPRDYDPGFIIRTAQVVTYFPGASPERVEKLVSDRIEEAVMEIPELDYVKSESRTGVSIVQVNIRESYTKMRPIWDSMRRKVEAAKSDLPDGIVGPIINDEFGDVFGIVLALSGEGFDYAEMEDTAELVRRELLRLRDVAKVELFGDQEQQIFIEYDNSKLAEMDLSPGQLVHMLGSQNILIPGGSVRLGSERITLEPSGSYESIQDITDTVLRLPGSERLIYLKDIARIERGFSDPPTSKTFANGQPVIALAISMRKGGNNIRLGKDVMRTVARIQSSLPHGLEIDTLNFSPAEVDAKVKGFVISLLQSVVVVTLVMLLFLGIRTGLVVASLIPFSMLLALLIMSRLSIGLDQISLAALIISLGMLVDNGVVISESVLSQMGEGKTPATAAVDSATELRIPLLTASVTTAAAFLPIYLAESSTGEYTASLFKVVTITLLCSWVLSLTIIPLLCARLLKKTQQKTTSRSRLNSAYRRVLELALKRRWSTLFVVTVTFLITLKGMGLVPTIFFPPSDRPYFKAEVELPNGTAFETTEHVVKDIESFLATKLKTGSPGNPGPSGVTSWIAYVGNGGPRFVLTHTPNPNSTNYALFVVNVSDASVIGPMMDRIDAFVSRNYPDASLKLSKIENGAPVSYPVEVRIIGTETGYVRKRANALKAILRERPGVRNVRDDWGNQIKKLEVRIDQPRALRAGISNEDVALSLLTGLSGTELTQYREESLIIPVVFRASEADRNDFTRASKLEVFSQNTGVSVPLDQVADVELSWEPSQIIRRDRLKTITVGAQLTPNVTAGQVSSGVASWLNAQEWPPGFRYEFGGEIESSQKANQSIINKLPIAVMIILVLLIGQFNSIRKALIVLITIPLGLIGVIAGLIVARSYFGFMTLLGIVSLAGIVINNAIVLLERIQIEIQDNGLSPSVAIVEAAQRRARPILLTTATTVLGLVPLYLGGGEMWEPMAVAIMAGLLFSTVLTLVVVPVLYAVLFRVDRLGAR